MRILIDRVKNNQIGMCIKGKKDPMTDWNDSMMNITNRKGRDSNWSFVVRLLSLHSVAGREGVTNTGENNYEQIKEFISKYIDERWKSISTLTTTTTLLMM